MEDELREGFITITGGHRVGLAGEVTTQFGKMERLKYITFFNIRIAKEIINIATPFFHYLHKGEHFFKDRKSTRLNSSHVAISYAVFCLKKKKNVFLRSQGYT